MSNTILITIPTQSTQDLHEQIPATRLVFIDPRVENYHSLVAGVLPNTSVVVLNADQDGIEQISEVLATHQEINSLHIVSHGKSGGIQLGNGWLTRSQLQNYVSQLESWKSRLTVDADILLYGCDVAKGEEGIAFVEQLSQLTGANVAASNNLTGSAAAEGDWNLEVTTGLIKSPLAFSKAVQEAYTAVLANIAPVISSSSNSALDYTENDPATVIDPGITIKDDDSTDLSKATVTITTGFATGEDTLSFDNSGSKITTSSYNSVTGVLTLSGNASVAEYETALRSVTYENSSDDPSEGDFTISFVVNDGTDDSTAVTREINLTAVNDAPVITTTATPLEYTEKDAATVIDSGITISDVDSTDLTKATVTISDFIDEEDSLSFQSTDNISGSYSNGVLTLTGNASVAEYETALRSVTYENSSDDPSEGDFTISFVVNDGTDDSTAVTREINLTAVNDAPVITTTATPLEYTEKDAATVIDSGITISDVDSTDLTKATVTISDFIDEEDSLSFQSTDNISGSYSNGVLTLTGNASVAEYETALRSVTYENSSDDPSEGDFTISFVVNDGTDDSTAVTREINLTAVNDAPVITTTATPLEYTEKDAATVIDSGITISDVDSTDLTKATVTISDFIDEEDTLSFQSTDNISGSYSNGVLTLTGNASVAEYETALRSVTYENSSDDPSEGDFTISFVVNDGTDDSTAVTREINLTAVNDAPVITTTATPLEYTEKDAATVIDSGITISDVDSTDLTKATVTISDFIDEEDTLSFQSTDNISGSYSNGVLTLTGNASVAEYETALRSVTYENSSDDPSEGDFTISFVVNDGTDDSTAVTREINLTAVNDAPVITTTATPLEYTEKDAATVIDSGITISDVDSTDLTKATVTISDFIDEEDSLSFQSTDNISGSYSNGVLTLTGNASVAEYETALRSVTYENSSDDPSEGDFTISFVVNDGTDDSTAVTREINLTAVNDAPVITTTATPLEYTEKDAATVIDSGITISDVDSTDLTKATVTISDFIDEEDTLSFQSTDNISGSYSNGVLTLTGNASVAEYETALRSVTYENSSDDPSEGDFTISFVVNDGTDDSTAVTREINLTAVNDAPVITTTATPLEYTEKDAATVIDSGITISDVDSTDLTKATVTISDFIDEEDSLSFQSTDNISGSYSNGVLTLTGNASVAEYETALRSVTYENSSDDPSEGDFTISFVVNDGTDDSTAVTREINLTAVNDAPVITTTATPLEYTEKDAATVIDSGITISDVDSTDLTKATVTISDFIDEEDSLSFQSTDNISGSYSNGVLTLTGNASVAEYETALRSVTYENSSDDPSEGDFTISFVVNDGTDDSTAVTREINLTAVNDAPVITTTATPLEYTEKDAATVIDSGITISDVDSTDLTKATVTISDFIDEEDSLSFQSTDNISGSYSNGVLTLTGNASVAEYETALRSVTYENSSDDPSEGDFTISFVVNDGTDDSTAVTREINLTAVNDAPVITTTATPLEYTEKDAATVIDSGITISDVDSTDLTKATVTISDFIDEEDSLSFQSTDNISGSYSNGVLTLTGNASVAEYETALRSVTYENSSDDPSEGDFTISFVVNDGTDDSTAVTREINLTAVNDAPVITTTATPLEYTEKDAATVIDSGITISDVDSTDLTKATVTISDFIDEEDTLSFQSTDNISGSYSNGVLTLTGNASVAEYETALRSVTYENSSDDPSEGDFTISFVVNDGTDDSTAVTREINLTAVNDAPVITTTATPLEYTEKDAATVIDSGITISDVDSTDLTKATVTISDFIDEEDTLSFQSTDNISGSYSNGVLTLTGNASVAEYETALRSVTYENSSDDPSEGDFTISFVVNDGTDDSTAVTREINLTAVNDAPVITTTATPLEYTEKDAATVIDSGITISDVDSTDLTKATVTISDFIDEEDTLSFQSTDNISGSYSNGVLTLTGNASVAEYETALRSVTYENSSDDPSEGDFTISFVVNDGTDDSTAVTREINLTAVNDAPVITTTATPLEYTEKDAATVIDSGITISDVDSTDLTKATVTISDFIDEEDSLSFQSTDNISGSYSNGVLTLTGNASVAEYETALRSVTYENSSDDPSEGDFTISFVVNDGTDDSTAVTREINLTAVNDAPVITTTATPLEYTEKDAATVIDSGITISDVDSTDLTKATVTISDFIDEEDSLSFQSTDNISGSYSNGVLTLTGNASVAEYETALRSVTYENSSDDPSEGDFTISFVVNDGTDDSTAVTREINLTAVNDAPVITTTATPLEYTEKDAATVIDSGITISDVDSTDLTKATVTITDGFIDEEDSLSFQSTDKISGSYSDGVLTLTGDASVAEYETALRSVTYENSSDDPSEGRTISFVVNDGTDDSTAVTREINLTAVNDAPVITTTATPLEYTEKDAATVIDSGITISDVDSTDLTKATVTITDGFIDEEDSLSFQSTDKISGSYSDGVLTLTGSASVADYQTALKNVKYENSSNNPTTGRTISFVVNDGTVDSTPVTRNINFTAVNDAPVITTSNAALEYTENDPATVIDPGITINDVDSTNLTKATVSITTGFATAEDSLSLDNPGSGITSNYDSVTGVLTLTGSASVADYQTALKNVKYENSSNNPTTGRTISFVVNDGTVDSTPVTRNINIATDVNDTTTLTKSANNDIFTIKGKGNDETARLSVKITGGNSNQIYELGLFVVDDQEGKIEGIAPGDDGYTEAALNRAKVIGSSLTNYPTGFSPDLNSVVELNSGEQIRFYLVRNNTTDSVLAEKTPTTDVVFSDPTNLKIDGLSDGSFSLALNGQNFVAKIQPTDQQLPLGASLQGQPEGELIDLSSATQPVTANFTVNREASYNDYVGFYQVADRNGGIDTNGDGKADISVNDPLYAKTAVDRRVAGIDLKVNNQGTASSTGTFGADSVFAPFIIVDGTPDAILNKNVYFAFLGANSDKADHIRQLATNTFGFEDLLNGGDKDYNDVIVKINLTGNPT